MKRPLQAGDNIAAYFCMGGRRTGIVSHIVQDIAECRDINGNGFQAHIKQCRRLIRKQKPREWTLILGQGGRLYFDGPAMQKGATIHVREVRKKEPK